MTVVAEGIETEEQVRALISSGVEEGQGYLVAAPLPFQKFSELVESEEDMRVLPPTARSNCWA